MHHIYSLQSLDPNIDHLRVQVIVISLVLESSSTLLCLSGLGELGVSNGFCQVQRVLTLKVLPKLLDCWRVVLNISYRRMSASETDRRANLIA